ncbi:MAG: hypothetical protein FWD76_04330, partial [Firmicutes bacterium]|nr:hypothetical protein [Bacillota bacterium]
MNIKTYETYGHALQDAIHTLKARKADLEHRHILIVPDHYTLACERRVYAGSHGAFDLDVLTFDRLLYALGEQTMQPLSKRASIMLIKSICLKNKFLVFGKSALFAGFAEKLYETIQMLQGSGIEPADLCDEMGEQKIPLYQGLAFKLRDISKIYEQYQESMRGTHFDGMQKYVLLEQAIRTSTKIKDWHFHIANFDYFSPMIQKVLEALHQKAKSCAVYATQVAAKGNIDHIEIYKASSAVEQVKAVAKRIILDTKNGLLYKDIGVVFKGDLSLCRRIFDEYDIPANIEIKYDLQSHPFVTFLMSLFDICENGYRQNEMLALGKNYFTGLTQQERWAWVAYVQKYGTNFDGFLQGFADDVAEGVRKKLCEMVEIFEKTVYLQKGAVAFCDALKNYLGAHSQNLARLSTQTDLDVVQIAHKVDKLVDDLRWVAGHFSLEDKEYESRFARECFLDALKSKVPFLPPLYDAVTVGEERVFRGTDKRKVYICDLNEGVLPSSVSERSLLSDAEIEHLKTKGLHLVPSTKDVNKLARLELVQLLHSGAEMVCLYIANEQSKPSFLLRGITQKTKNIRHMSYEYEMQLLGESEHMDKTSPHWEDFGYAQALHFGSVAACKELFLKKSIQNHKELSALYWALQATAPNQGTRMEQLVYKRQAVPLRFCEQMFFGVGESAPT